ncbi:Carboxylesterase 2 [Candidatus Kinetoplastibacterium sorsogonicusi]|uniref:Carboxylesterase 2 n=1 Tax=Candidatus Kinetoplastidibacterium kentomonadis TaxID=1576550 RepID=A0A3Q8ERX9_9PROT|nr:hypothetical protein [Candidatus Kinetoplastibacterium sorsogonicusi]AWD32692.1 Carboxylesterase 2 [Candidatus Kinetoplastibacterium sorsogonicusi]
MDILNNKITNILQINNKSLYTVICIHGLGANRYDLLTIYNMCNLNKKQHIKFLFLEAAYQYITFNKSHMRAWFDIYNLETLDLNINDIYQTINEISKVIMLENKKGIPNSNIIIIGFSQGAIIALSTLISIDIINPMAGIISLSGYIPDILYEKINLRYVNTPIMFAHGKYDNIIPIINAKQSFNYMKNFFPNIIYREYNMNHTICNSEINDISEFINKNLK